MPDAIDLNDMYLFAKVVEHGGYSAASRALGIATSKLSRRVSELERQLGVHLLNRTTRKLSLSSTGESFHRRCLAVVKEAEGAREDIEQARTAPRGEIRMSCPTGLLVSDVAAILARFMGDNPAVRISLEATNRRVDVVEEGFDLAIRVRFPPLEDSELASRKLGFSQMILVCSRWFVSQYGTPETGDALGDLPTLSMARPGNKHAWVLVDERGRSLEVTHRPRLATDDLSALLVAALEGVGVALLPESLVAKHLAEGRLIEVMPALRPVPGVVHAVFPSRRGLVPAVRLLIDALVAGFAQQPGSG